MAFGRLLQLQDTVHDGAQQAASEEGGETTLEGLRGNNLLFERARPEHGAAHMRALSHQDVKVQFGVCACQCAYDDDPTFRGEACKVLRQVGAPNEIEDDVCTTMSSSSEHLVHESAILHQDAVLEPQLATARQLLGGACRAEAERTHCLCDLQRRSSHAASRSVP